MPLFTLGLDIGGANLKAVHLSDAGPPRAVSHSFPLWKWPDDLPVALRELIREFPRADLLAVTMTGELCDCYETKRQGVHAILDAVAHAWSGRPPRIWGLDGRFADVPATRANPVRAAAANWLALATAAGRLAPAGPSVLVDIGTTTADLIPLQDGVPVPRGRTDPERLRSGELIYTGVTRTPVCAVVQGGVMAELFATMRDVYLILEELPEAPDDRDTADGRPATRAHAHARLARMLGGDGEEVVAMETLELARRARVNQQRLLAQGLDQVPGGRQSKGRTTWILSGAGEFLARSALRVWSGGEDSLQTVSLAETWGAEVSRAACAYAVARLAWEEAEG